MEKKQTGVMCVLGRASYQGPMTSSVPRLVMVSDHVGRVVPLPYKVSDTFPPFVVDKFSMRIERSFETMQNPSTFHAFSY